MPGAAAAAPALGLGAEGGAGVGAGLGAAALPAAAVLGAGAIGYGIGTLINDYTPVGRIGPWIGDLITPQVGQGSGGKGRGNTGERKQQDRSPNPDKTDGKPDNQTGKKETPPQKPVDEKPPIKQDRTDQNDKPWQQDPRKYVDPKGDPNNPSPPKDYCPAPIR